MNTVFDDLATQYVGQNLLVVGHFGQILTQVQRAERLKAEEAFAHRIDNLSVTEVVKRSDGWSLQAINQTL